MSKQIKITINSPYLIMVKILREGILSKEILEGTNTVVKKKVNRIHSQSEMPIAFYI